MDQCNSSHRIEINIPTQYLRTEAFSVHKLYDSYTSTICDLIISVPHAFYIRAYGGLKRENNIPCNGSTVLRINDIPIFNTRRKREKSILYCSSILKSKVIMYNYTIPAYRSFVFDRSPLILSRDNKLFIRLQTIGNPSEFWLVFEQVKFNYINSVMNISII